ncbi:MAG TPA: restriction endonuclease subunit S [Daejeonella sp.]|uniref:restriction endonuclease subunit S n=1 Tax=Daejeonella sp. TaxID=2805397 RepID=UPI002ED84982
MGFKQEKFKKLIEHKSGYTWGKEQELDKPEQGTVRVLTVTNIQEKLDLSSKLYLKDVKDRDRKEKSVSKDWTIAVSSNGNRKRIGNAIFISDDTDYLFASFLTAFKPKQDADITPEYFFQWFSSHVVQERITSVSEGTTGLGNLDIRYLRNMDIEYPDNEVEQKAIATILSKVDEAIKATENSIKAAEKLKKSLMQNLLTGKLKPDGTWRKEDEFYKHDKFGNCPVSWHWGRLSEIADIVAGQSPSGEFYNEDGIGTPMLNGPTEFTDLHPIPVQFTTKVTKLCQIGDILFTVRGSSTGRMNIADQEYCIGRGIAAIRAKEGSDIDFIYYTLVTISEKILAEAKGAGTTFPNVSRGELLKKWVLIPDTDQSEISSKIKSLDAFLKEKQKKVFTIQRLKKSLMQNLLTGKVRVDLSKIENILNEI